MPKAHKHKLTCYNRAGIPVCGQMTRKERTQYEDLIDAADGARAIRDLAEGRDRIVSDAETNRRLAEVGLDPL